MSDSGAWKNKLFFGDNLGILRREVQSESVAPDLLIGRGRGWPLPAQRSAGQSPPRRAGFVSRPAASASLGGLAPRGSLARRLRPGMGREARRRRQGGALSRSRNKADRPGRGVPLGCRPAGHLLCRRSSACLHARPPRAFANLHPQGGQRAKSPRGARPQTHPHFEEVLRKKSTLMPPP